MGKIRRANHIFITRKGDHDPRHVHVFRDSRQILKWDLENDRVMEGKITRKVRKLIEELKSEGAL